MEETPITIPILIQCADCRSLHYVGEPCGFCFHQEKDKKDIEKHRKVFGEHKEENP